MIPVPPNQRLVCPESCQRLAGASPVVVTARVRPARSKLRIVINVRGMIGETAATSDARWSRPRYID